MQVYKLKFHSALHVDSKGSGEPEVSDDFIRSDTLSAALCLSWAAVYQDVDAAFFEAPPFTVSSAFPYVGEMLFFPIPAWPVWAEGMEDSERKKFKKIRWISQGILDLILAGKPVNHKAVEALPNNGIAFLKNESAAHPELKTAETWAASERQRVRVDRLNLPGEGGLFFFALQFFGPESGLWFLASGKDEVLKKFRGALDYLGDTGIGSDRNSGLGHFEIVETSDFNPSDFKLKGKTKKQEQKRKKGRRKKRGKGKKVKGKKEKGCFMLSLFNPDKSDNLKALTRKTAYNITSRSGWIVNAGYGRPPIRVFTEGSYFSAKPKGRVVEMLPEDIREENKLALNHSAPRDFRAVFLPCANPAGIKEVNS